MRQFFFMLFSGLVLFLLGSCADDSLDFTRDEIDSTVNLGGENLVIPIGTLEKITMADLVEKMDVGGFTVREDGLCALTYQGQSNVEMDKIAPITFRDVEFDFQHRIEIPALQRSSHYTLPIHEPMDLEIHGTIGSSQIVSINRFRVENTNAEIHMSFDGPDILYTKGVHFKGELRFPEKIHLGGSYAGVTAIPIDEKLTKDGFSVTIPLSEFFLDDLKIDQTIDIKEEFVVAGELSANLSLGDIAQLRGPLDFKFNMFIRNIVPTMVEAKVDYTMDYSDEMLLAGVPDELKGDGVVLDMENPYLLLGMHHDLTFGIGCDLTMTSVRNGVDQNQVTVNGLDLEGVESEADVSYLLASSKDYVLESFDHYLEAHIRRLLQPVPETVRLDARLATDREKNIIFYFNRPYSMDMEYAFIIPMVMGKDFHVNVVKEVTDLSVNMNANIEADLTLLASLENSLPANIVFSAYAVGADGERLNLEIGEFSIASCKADGSAVKQEVEIPIKGKLSEISAMKGLKLLMDFVSGESAGVPVMGDDYVCGSFALKASGGITVDMGQMGNK